MRFIAFVPHALIIAVLGASLNYFDSQFGVIFTWIGFIAWASYFFNGGTVQGGIKIFACWAGGVFASVLIVLMGTYIAEYFGEGFVGLAFPFAVFCVAFCIILFEKVPNLDLIPAWFIGSGCFFGLYSEEITAAVIGTLVSCAVGLFYGYLSILLRGAYDEALSKSS